MLRSLSTIVGSSIHAQDGEMGNVGDFLFDDKTWVVRYVVVETGNWLSSRKVLVSPSAIGQVDWNSRSISVVLTTQQVRDSPEIDTDLPVSRQQEIAMSQYYGWPAYWSMEFIARVPGGIEEGDRHLRSATEVSGYDVLATDGELGNIGGFIVNDTDWLIRYLAVRAGSWFQGHEFLIPSRWVDRVSWSDRQVFLSQSREAI